MSNISECVKDFFTLLDIGADRDRIHYYKEYIASAANEFLKSDTKETAYDVYSFFLDIYRFNISGEKSFIDLLDVLKSYEENAAILSDTQRDHYVHSVNVFLLGLGIYAKNPVFRDNFKVFLSNRESQDSVFESIHEEFFFRWGISSLFHDIGYPVEIVHNQLDKFIGFVSGDDEKGRASAGPFIDYFDFSKLNSISNYDKNNYSIPEYMSFQNFEYDFSKPTEILAGNISRFLHLDFNYVIYSMNGFLDTMQKYRFVDHGFYSSLIVLKWYGELTGNKAGIDKLYYNHILDAAVSIFLHNAYRNVFMREPYNLGILKPGIHPLAYLLILCDEIQEWNRQAYGEITKTLISVDSSKIDIYENNLQIHYITKHGVLEENFTDKKMEFINSILDIDSVFEKQLILSATKLSEKFIRDIVTDRSGILPRIIIEYIEQIAMKIHNKYIDKQKENFPDARIEFPTWESLPETLKYSNIRQARDMVGKLQLINCFLDETSDNQVVNEFTEEEIEFLAEVEHQHWVDERIATGWKNAKTKNVTKKESPYLVPYAKLPEEIKDLDRDTIRNIIPLVREVGLKVFRR